ncbi:MAG: UPF0147 family protein [Candidatus Hadarchaeales archaeon]
MTFEDKIKQVVEIMTRISEDMSVPRNIRRTANEAKNILLDEKQDQTVRAASARILLEEISEDPNMPVHARTQLWSALSILETIR